MNSNIIFGVDPGYDRIGFALLTYEKKPCVVHSECFITDRNDVYGKRVLAISLRMQSLLNEYAPSAVSVEKIFFKNNQKTAIDVAGVRGVILCCAFEKNIPVVEYSPSQIKTTITGVGNADKTQIHKMISLLVNLDKKDRIDDEVDAIAVGITHIVYSNNPLTI